jgi:hypothetical protein
MDQAVTRNVCSHSDSVFQEICLHYNIHYTTLHITLDITLHYTTRYTTRYTLSALLLLVWHTCFYNYTFPFLVARGLCYYMPD